MSQLATLTWLKWKLFRNSLRSPKAAINRFASILGMLLALLFALAVAAALGGAAYALTHPQGLQAILARQTTEQVDAAISAEFIFFTIFAFSFLIWATVPLTTGSSRQFDPGNLLMYPISLKKLFLVDLISELATLQSIFAVPAIIALGIGAGLGSGRLLRGIIAGLVAAIFGLALTKWLAVSIGSLTRRKRTRGETLIALIGAGLGLAGALVGQVAPMIFKHADFVRVLRWTPPGASAFALSGGITGDIFLFILPVTLLLVYATLIIWATFWVARRSALGIGGHRKVSKTRESKASYTGWELPLLSPALSAIVEKEFRYVWRNAQVRMMALMPLILIIIRLVNTRRFGSIDTGTSAVSADGISYGHALMATGGVLYVFLVLSGLSCNLFAFEEGGMRAMILSPVKRRNILLGKNIAVTIVALCFSVGLLLVNHLIFWDLTWGTVFFATMSFISFAALMPVMGNWFSIRFPKHMKFGKRMNVSGVVGLLLIPMVAVLALPPLGAIAAGYITESLAIEYVTLLLLAALSVCLYLMVIDSQGELLERREVEVLEAVREPVDI